MATALRQGKGVLGLVAAGTPADHPDLLPKQVWHHYTHVREAGSQDTMRRLELSARLAILGVWVPAFPAGTTKHGV